MEHVSRAPKTDTWWRMLRPHTLTASFVPVAVGTALALYESPIRITLFLAMLAASLLIQAATNAFNEYYDYVRGLDDANSIGIGGTIVRDGVTPKTVFRLALLFYFVAMLLGIYICAESSWWIAVIGLISMAVGYFYTAGPLPIAYTPFGELFAGFFMGPVIILITIFIQTGNVTLESFLVSLSVGVLIGALNMANNIRDLDGDQEHGRKTLAILLGRPKAIVLLGSMFAAAHIWIVILVMTQTVSPWALLVLLSIPKAMKAVKQYRGKSKPIEMMPGMKSTGQLNTIFGFLLAIGLFVGYALLPSLG